MTLFVPPPKPYICGCNFVTLCDEHKALLEEQRRAILKQINR